MSENAATLAQKNIDRFAAGNWLCIEPGGKSIVASLSALGKCTVLCSDSRDAYENQQAGFDKNSFDHALMFLPKGKALRDMYLGYIKATLKPGGTLWLVGEIKLGAKSAAKILGETIGQTKKVASAKHCVLYQSELQQSASFNPDDYYQQWEAEVAGQALTLCSQPGVYGHGKIDEGTELLLTALPKVSGRVIDLGCGGGLISAWLLKQNPKLKLTACDISALAVSATQRTVAANQLSAKVIASDVFSNIDGRYDFIISNPPFHDGFDTSYNAVRRLISEAPYHLYNGGQLIIVANRHLKYGDWLQEHFGEFSVLAETKRFKVYSATNTI